MSRKSLPWRKEMARKAVTAKISGKAPSRTHSPAYGFLRTAPTWEYSPWRAIACVPL